jgi:transcriptional regulator NrdR family protein
MKCPNCKSSNTRVTHTYGYDTTTMRRHICQDCACRWKSYADIDAKSIVIDEKSATKCATSIKMSD